MGHLFTPAEAKEVGLVDRLYATDEEGEKYCSEILHKLTKSENAPSCFFDFGKQRQI